MATATLPTLSTGTDPSRLERKYKGSRRDGVEIVSIDEASRVQSDERGKTRPRLRELSAAALLLDLRLLK